MIGIRADANNVIATGHIMRCITIARELNKLGEKVLFITADDCADVLLDNAGMKHISIHTDWQDMESELEVLTEVLQTWGIETLLIDSYSVTYDYVQALNRVVNTAYIDDLHEHILPVDILINYSGYVDRFDYATDYLHMNGRSGSTKLLLGLKYAPLREQFYETKSSYGDGKQVLLCAGGGDKNEVMLGVLSKAIERGIIEDINWHVVIGNYVDSEEQILDVASKYENIVIHKAVSNMAELMGICDMAIAAAGTMLTECAAMRLPAVFYKVADNQRYGVEYWSDDRQIYAGDVEADRESTIENILDVMAKLIQDTDKRRQIADKLGLITDGKGAVRIAEELIRI